jgi:hypothetical protein
MYRMYSTLKNPVPIQNNSLPELFERELRDTLGVMEGSYV